MAAFHHHNNNSGGNHHNNHHNGSSNKQGEILSKSDFQTSIELMHDRADYAIVNSIGSKINVTTKDLKIISGILRTIKDGPDGILDLLIQYPTISGNVGTKTPFTDFDKSQAKAFSDELVTIKFDDILKFELVDVKFDSKSNTTKTNFQTDTSISKPIKNNNNTSNKQLKDNNERVLVQWTPDEGDNISNPSLNDDLNSNENWDQFATNKTKFNVTSTFNEDLYTTKLNTKGADFEKRKMEADKIAREIESQKSSNIHLAEERNQEVDDSNVDEEDKYSGVQRPTAEVQKNSEDSKKLMNLLTSKIDYKQQSLPQAPQQASQQDKNDDPVGAKQSEKTHDVKSPIVSTSTSSNVKKSPKINSPETTLASQKSVSNTVSASSSKPVSKKSSPMLSSDSIKSKPKPKPDFSSFNFNSNAFTPSSDKKSKFQQQKTPQQTQRVLNQRTANYNNYNNLNHPQNVQQFHPPTYSPQQQFLPPQQQQQQQQHHHSPQNYYQQHPMQYAPHPIQAAHIPQQSNPLPLHNQHGNAPPQFQHQIPQLPHQQQKQQIHQTPKFFVDGKEPKSAPPKLLLANKFNFLKSAKEEYLSKNPSKQEIGIIPIEKSFAVASWNVNSKSFIEYFQKDLPAEIIQPNYNQSMNSRNMYPMVAMPMVGQFYSYPANVAFTPGPNVGGGGGVGW